jgi:hypothetical protein
MLYGRVYDIPESRLREIKVKLPRDIESKKL